MNGIARRLLFIGELAGNKQPALLDSVQQLTYRDLAEKVSTLADWLTGQKVQVLGLHLQNCIDWVIIDLACQDAGVVCVPLPTFFSDSQIEHCLQQAGIDTLVSATNVSLSAGDVLQCPVIDRHIQVLKISALPANLPKGSQKITFTSGSTGKPKGVCLSIDHQWQVAQSLADHINMLYPRHSCLLPLSTLLENIAGVYTPMLCGGTVQIADDHRGLSGSSGLDSKALFNWISVSQPETLILLPQLLSAMVGAIEQGWLPPDSLHFVAVGGSRVSPSLIKQARNLGIPVYQGYGLSECGSVVALNTPREDRIDQAGKVLPHCRVHIENSEVIVDSPCHLGYLGQPESWYPKRIATGDLGSLDKGYLTINGRRKNLLISSFGRNINPEWLESELLGTGAISQCMVVGDDRPYVAALISAPKKYADDMLADRIHTLNATLPDYAQIKRWLRVPDEHWRPLMTANGRIQRSHANQQMASLINELYNPEPLIETTEVSHEFL